MSNSQAARQIVLDGLQEQITTLVEADQIDTADLFLQEYIKLAPEVIERFALEALVRIGQDELNSAISILNKGFAIHPNSFDLLFNLGFAYQLKGDVISARNAYAQALELAKTQEEKDDLEQVLSAM
ncbi:MAG TPA: tetratricopeptide repeat protein [Clostridiaceae bacterium]|nr:tetratricopeptide repeat protein [Clostridiaceae bacterium]